MKRIALLALVTVAASISGASAKARREVVVVAPAPLAVWKHNLAERLSDSMNYPRAVLRDDRAQGYARVRFVLDEAGRPTAMTVARKSGIRAIDNAAMRAVGSMVDIPRAPAEVSGRQIEAHLFFAQSPEDLRDMQRANRADMRRAENVASYTRDRTIVLSAASWPQGGSAN